MQKHWKIGVSLSTATALTLAALGCSALPPADGDGDGDGMDEPTTVALTVTFEGLEALGEAFVYEGWLIVDGAPISTGRFTIDEDGAAVPSQSDVDADSANAAELFVLTIEPADDDDPAPAATHVLAGAFDAGTAVLTVGHDAALGDDFAAAAGSYILETPSTGEVAEDYDQGIWWLDPAGGPGASLDLPTLPEGWIYEGWVVGPDGPVSTGRFAEGAGEDDDGVGPTGGPDTGPPFPGQDFIEPSVVIIGHVAVISVEPEPDDSPGPFAIKPLIDMDIEDLGAGVLQSMENGADGAPTGTATLAAE